MTNSVTDAMVEKALSAFGDAVYATMSHKIAMEAALTRIAPDLIAAGRRQGLEEAAKIAENRAEELMRGTENASIQEIERRGWHLNLSQSRALKQIADAIRERSLIPPPGEVK